MCNNEVFKIKTWRSFLNRGLFDVRHCKVVVPFNECCGQDKSRCQSNVFSKGQRGLTAATMGMQTVIANDREQLSLGLRG